MTRSTTRTTPPHDLPIFEPMPEARRWFDDLSDEDWYAVVEALPPLHPVADWHGGGIPGRAQRRRAVPKLRKHVKHLPDVEFTDLLATSFGRARELLLGRGYTRDQVEHPDLPLLRRMLDELPDPLARGAGPRVRAACLGDPATVRRRGTRRAPPPGRRVRGGRARPR